MEWISVKEQLPATKEKVLVIGEYGLIYVASWDGDTLEPQFDINCNCEEGSSVWKPTHWMPLPERPEKQKIGRKYKGLTLTKDSLKNEIVLW